MAKKYNYQMVGPQNADDVQAIKDKEAKKVNRLNTIKHYAKVAMWGTILGITASLGWYASRWSVTNTLVFHSPIEVKWFNPVVAVNKETYKQEQEMAHQVAEIKRLAIEQYTHPDKLPKCNAEVMEKIDPQKFWDKVFLYESTNDTATTGLNAYCKAKGKSNPIGYSPSTKFCFNSLEEAQLFVPFYVSNKCHGLTLNECLCKWNEGDPDGDGKYRADCPYAQGKLSLAN